MGMETLFPLNRYNVQPIIEHINSLLEIPESFEIEVEEPYLCIEINEGNQCEFRIFGDF